jgi:hypothetical protein
MPQGYWPWGGKKQRPNFEEDAANAAAGIPAGIPFPGSSQSESMGSNQSTTNTSGTSRTQYDNSSMPIITKEYRPMLGKLNEIIMQRLGGSGGLPAGYQESAIRGVNKVYDDVLGSADNEMAARGIYGDAGHAARVGASEAGRAGKIADVKMSLPLLARQFEDDAIGQGQGLISSFGRGQRDTGTSTTNSSSTSNTEGSNAMISQGLQGPDPTSLLMGHLSAATGQPLQASAGSQGMNTMMNMLALMYGSGAFGGRGK